MKKQKKQNYPDIIKTIKNHIWAILIAILLFSFLIYNYVNKGILFDLLNSNVSEISEFINGYGVLAPIIFVLLLIVEIVVAPISGAILSLVGGALFGTVYGGTLLIIGNFIGSSICFLIARKIARKPIEVLVTKEKMWKFDEYSKKYGAFALFVIKANPLTGSDIWNYVAGITKMTFRSFAIAIFFSSIPMAYLQAFFGYRLVQWNPIFYTWIMIASLIYIFMFIIGVYYIVWKYKTKLEERRKLRVLRKKEKIKKQRFK